MTLLSNIQRYGMVAGLSAAAVALGLELDAPVSCFALVVMASTLFIGQGPGLLSVVLSVLSFDYFFLPPLSRLAIEPSSYLRFLVFVATSVGINRLIEAKRIADTSRRKTDEQQRIITETVPDAIITFDTDDRILVVNPAASRVFGWQPFELTGKPIGTLLPELPRGKFPPRIELAGLRKDGTGFVAEAFFGQAIAGEQHFFTGCVRDISERKRTEEALRTSEHNLRLLIEVIPGLVCLYSAEGRLEYVNQRVLDYTGRTMQDLAKLGWGIVLHPDHAQMALDTWLQSVTTGRPHEVEFKLRCANGEYRWFQARTEPLRDNQGLVIRWYGLLFDIDERKRAEEALQASERGLGLIIETLPGLVWCAAPDGELEFVNQRILDYTGANLNQLMKLGWTNYLHPDDLETATQAWSHSVATGQPHEVEYRFRRFDGGYRWFQALGRPLRDREGRMIRWYGLLIDIEDRKNMEEALRSTQTRLSRATQIATVGELAASIAHEINQPLAAVVTNGHACMQWLSSSPPSVENARLAAERIIRDGNGAAEVVRRIRALFRRAALEKVILDMNEVIGEVLRLLHGEIVKRRVAVEANLETGLPRTAGDRVQLQQVLLNLILNGIEAMDTLTERPKKLRIASRRQGADAILVEVRDYGPGLADPEKIFEAFFTTKQTGMGIGLPICRSIIEAHEGKLWAVSNKDAGATFSFTLPLEPGAPS